jgi:hypothetical protein
MAPDDPALARAEAIGQLEVTDTNDLQRVSVIRVG